ncbi:MAG: hypothetical protein BWX80_00499 [Candidatus Hydrogenedentes bacterium ADurb.Bin101]|jgi:hypothetical protein|nr:MAG: hypothetical protein BWX80_00499 [Candidatus Hydrogenedentes bacterium ADurb.Bin101]
MQYDEEQVLFRYNKSKINDVKGNGTNFPKTSLKKHQIYFPANQTLTESTVLSTDAIYVNGITEIA